MLIPRVLIHSYRLQYDTVPLSPGFGDYLRGTLALSCLAIKYNYRLCLDLYSHPLAKYMASSAPKLFSSGRPVECFNSPALSLEKLLSRRISCLPFLVSTNAYPDSTILNDHARDAVRSLLRFGPETDPSLCKDLGILNGKYAVLHIRLRDEIDVDRVPSYYFYDELRASLDLHIAPVFGSKVVLISNNEHVRRRLSSDYRWPSVSSRPIHLGKSATKNEERAVRDTIIDFRVMSNASRIYSYSEYGWPSGFSMQCANIFRIPFVDLRSLMLPMPIYPVVVENV